MPKNHPDVGPMALKNVKTQRYGYENWVSIKIVNHGQSRDSIVIKNVTLEYGRFYETGNRLKAIPLEKINGQVIAPGQSYTVNSSGYWGSFEGTSGSFEIAEMETGALIGKATWMVLNKESVQTVKEMRFDKAKNTWSSSMTGWNYDSEKFELGEGSLTLTRI